METPPSAGSPAVGEPAAEQSAARRPDIIVRWTAVPPTRVPPAEGDAAAYAVVYVRPETNTVLYERAIVSGIRVHGSLAYLANLDASLFRRDRILERHYASQFRFAIEPREALGRYPEMVHRFEEHFGVSLSRARLAGAFEALELLSMDEEQLFDTIVPEDDYLSMWGQELKRIGGLVVANPSLPAVVNRYVPGANVFVAVARCREPGPEALSALNRSIYEAVVARHETPILDGDRLGALVWKERIRRTYHISSNHLMAMFDMADLVYVDDDHRLDVTDTPLGRRLAAGGRVSEEQLRHAHREQLVYIGAGAERTLCYLPQAGEGKGVRDIEEMLAALQALSPLAPA